MNKLIRKKKKEVVRISCILCRPVCNEISVDVCIGIPGIYIFSQADAII